jgi:hypothetical protein
VRGAALAALSFLMAGCLAAGPAITASGPPAPHLSALSADGARIVDSGLNRTFLWQGSVKAGANPPLVTGNLLPAFDHVSYRFPLDGSVGEIRVAVGGPNLVVAELFTDSSKLACTARTGQNCTIAPPAGGPRVWTVTVTSLTPAGATFVLNVTLSPWAPILGADSTPTGRFDVIPAVDATGKPIAGGEPTLAVLQDGSVLVVANNNVERMDPSGRFTDVTPPLDKTIGTTLDPFLVGDPVTGRVYASQLDSCLRLSWTDDGGNSWVTNPKACAGPDQHHQKIAVGPGPTGREVHVATMNLATWLATQKVVITHSWSPNGGLTWAQSPAMTPATTPLSAHAVGNIAIGADGTINIIAYLCDRFIDAHYQGVGVGRSMDNGATWTWTQIAPGGGPCDDVDPGLWASGATVVAAWDDASAGTPHEWFAQSADSGKTWSKPSEIPTPGLRSFVLTDAVSSSQRVAVAFLASPDTAKAPSVADGWARWYLYVATRELVAGGASWDVEKVQSTPVQVGPICMEGPDCFNGARNLLDFLDIQFGPSGGVYVAYTQGCPAVCAEPWESRLSDLRIASEREGGGGGVGSALSAGAAAGTPPRGLLPIAAPSAGAT